jgi:hypothetical protein
MDIQEITEKPWFIPTVVGVTASVGGFIIGGIVGLRVGYSARMKDEKEEQEAQDIIGEVREILDPDEQLEFKFDATVGDLAIIETTEITIREFEDDSIVEELRNDPNPRNDPRDIRVDGPPMIYIDDIKNNNVFDTSFDHWDYEEEIPRRSQTKPHIIHRDEFWGEEKGYEQSTLTYYIEDDILTDQEDTPIYGYEAVTGKLLFGHGSGDINTVYIRNDKQSAEYEVLRFEGAYSREILGVSLEEDSAKSDLRHSVRKFRPRDD